MKFTYPFPTPAEAGQAFPQGGRSEGIISPLGEIRKGVFEY